MRTATCLLIAFLANASAAQAQTCIVEQQAYSMGNPQKPSGVPNYAQADFVGSNDCGPTAVNMLLGYYDANGWACLMPGSGPYYLTGSPPPPPSPPAGVVSTDGLLKDALPYGTFGSPPIEGGDERTGVPNPHHLPEQTANTDRTPSGPTRARGHRRFESLFRDGGGFGGPRPPKRKIVKIPKDTEPTWSFDEFISPEQALLYRLSGDHNPLHADPKFAKEVGFDRGPILHGLASYGYVCRAVAIKSCGGEASKIASLQSQFRNPIWPADTIVHDAYDVDGEILLKSYSREEPETVVAISVATLR